MDGARILLRADVKRTYDYATGSPFQRVLRCIRAPGVHAVVVYRFGQWVMSRSLPVRLCLDPIYMLANELIKIMWGIELPRSARIGRGLYIGHFGAIVLSPGAVIGANCNLSPSITIGVSGKGERRGVPVIGDNVYVASGARIFGRITVGNNVKIGANAVVYKDVPDNAVVVLAPGFQIISYDGNDGSSS